MATLMEYLDRTLETPEANLAFEEGLLAECVKTGREFLHVWEPPSPSVIAGYSNPRFEGIDVALCRSLGIPVLRRSSGGGAVVIGPGCLNYSLILAIPARGALSTISGTNAFIMSRLERAMAEVSEEEVRVAGQTDLVIGNRKFSGNAQRRRREALLFHGTVMLGMDIDLIERTLDVPFRAPAYRRGRSHVAFLRNLRVSGQDLKSALRSEFHTVRGASVPLVVP